MTNMNKNVHRDGDATVDVTDAYRRQNDGTQMSGSQDLPMQLDVGTEQSATSSDLLSHDVLGMSLDELRQYRRDLNAREGQVSYWRRILQARLDLMRDGSIKHGATTEGLRRVLTRQLGSNNRLGLLSVHPQGNAPMAGLTHLWHRSLTSDDNDLELEHDLARAEYQLSTYRSELHERIDEATAELVRRYHENPALALTALPSREGRPSPL